MSVARVRESPFRESEWDRRLDDMLEDLGTNTAGQGGTQVVQTQQSFSSSMQQRSFSTQQGTRTQVQSQQSQSQQKWVQGGRSNGLSLTKSPSSASLKDSADAALKDLEDGLLKSTNYIQESRTKDTGPGSQFDLEQQVQHMIPMTNSTQSHQTSSYQTSSQTNQQFTTSHQQQQQQFTTYKVQSNQYTSAGNELETDQERPGSRLKQNIDELDTLLYDLNNARNLSPERGPDQPTSPLLDSDDYDETVGTAGHVKKTVSAFNEYSQQMADTTKKPPSPSPRRKAPTSPNSMRKTPTSPSPGPRSQHIVTQSHSSSYQQHQSERQIGSSPSYHSGPPGSNQPFSYLPETSPPATPEQSYYSKYSSSKTTPVPPRDLSPPVSAVPFPSQTTRSPTPQSPPKRIDELMSEFREFDSVHSGGSPVPPMFSNNSTVEVTELPDGPPQNFRQDPEPEVRDPSPTKSPRQVPVPAPKGPDVYYPPGSEFTAPIKEEKVEEPAKVVADGGSLSLAGEKRAKAAKERSRHERGADAGDKQGAAVIPICLPLCCAAPCVIM